MIFYNNYSYESDFLEAVLKIKKIEYTSVTADDCAIKDKEIFIDDLFTAIRYLEERHPKPRLFSDIPEQNARLNLFVKKIVENVYPETNQTHVFMLMGQLDQLKKDTTFLAGEQITIADLVLYPLLPDHYRIYRRNIRQAINNLQKD